MQWLTEETGWILPEESGPWTDAGLGCGDRISPAALLRLGTGLASAASRCMIGTAPDSDFARAAALTAAGAAAAAGAGVILVPDCVPAELRTASAAGECGAVLYADETGLRLYAGGLLPLTKRQSEALEQAAAARELPAAGRSEYGTISDGRSLRLLCSRAIIERLPEQLPVRAEFNTASERLRLMMTRLCRGGSGESLTVQLSADGRRASVYTLRSGWIFYEKLLLMLCAAYLRRGEDVALPYWLPRTAERMAAESGRRILRYASLSDGSDADARALAARQGFTLDGTVLAADFLRILAEEEPDLNRWAASLPPCFTVRRILRTERSLDAAAGCGTFLHTEQTPEGLRASDARGEALLHPSRSGRSVSMLVEAASMEAATELAGDIAAALAGSAGRMNAEFGMRNSE
ncbi:MAG: hypothetical protein IK107_06000 [Oscillospiraceae bacterium]|nr:hypothetical protein [Oscillospiraceae bacterium]